MKNNLKWLLIILTFGIFTSNVNAEETEYVKTVDNDGYSISVDVAHSGTYFDLNMILNGMEEEEDANYYVKFVNGNDEMPTLEWSEEDGCNDDLWNSDKSLMDNWYSVELDGRIYEKGHISVDNDWYMLSEYNYAYVVKSHQEGFHNYCEITKEPIKVARPDLPNLGERYNVSLFASSNRAFVFELFPNDGNTGSHTLNIKVGIINDNELLSKLAYNTSDSLTSLMEYAKTHEGKVFRVADDDNEWNYDLDIVANAYYYIYTTYENEDGLYRDLSDVMVVKANDIGSLYVDFDWDIYSTKWEQLVEKMTSNEEDSLSSLYNLNVVANDNIITVSTEKDDKIYTMTYTYKDGIVSASASSEETYYVLGNVVNSYVLNYVSEILHYNTQDFRNWLNTIDSNNLSLQKDGIEYNNKVYKTNEGKDIEYYSDLKINIDNGISSYHTNIQNPEVPKAEIINKEESKQDATNVETTVENPNTGVGMGVTGICGIIVIIGYFFTKRKNHFNRV